MPNKKGYLEKPLCGSEEPEFPASMLFGLCLGFAFGGGCEDFVGVRQSRTLLAVQGAESFHQGL